MSANVTELVAYVPPPSPEVNVYSLCSRLEAWAAEATDLFLLKDNKSKLSAYDHYLAQTSKEGRNQIAATLLRLENRIGELLPPAADTRGRHLPREEEVLTEKERHFFRRMAANPDVVEAVIAAGTDENPASRRKVLEAIKDKDTPKVPDVLDRSPKASAERAEKARQMAAQGHTSKQIAAGLGLGESGISHFLKRHSIEVPADAFAARSPRIDSNRVIEATVDQVRGISTGLNLVDWSALEIDKFPEWIASLKAARRALYTLIDNLEKETKNRGSE